MVDLRNIPNAHLKFIFIVHFILSSWGIQGLGNPSSYFFYNLIFMLVILWAIHHHESPEPMQMAFIIGASSILLDIIVIIIYLPNSHWSSERFSVCMAILNLIIRPITTLVLYRIYCDRAGSVGSVFPNAFGQIFSGGGGQRTYEDIDNLQSVPRTDIDSPSQFSPNTPDDKLPPPYHGL